MKFRTLICLLLVILLLSGCGKAGDSAGNKADIAPEAGMSNDISASTTILPSSQKLIRTLWLDAETEDMEQLLDKVNARIEELNGYVEDQQIYHGSAYSGRRYRHADLTIRIPAENMQDFANSMAEVSNITSTNETTEDVTLQYVATESQKIALETEQTRLLELLAKAENLSDVLKIESRLTEIRGQLESIISQLRVYDNQVNYSTIHLSISEVTEYTDTTEPETLWDRIVEGSAASWKAFGQFMEDLLVFVIVSIPFLLPIAAIIVLIVFLKKRKKKKGPKDPTDQFQGQPKG